MPNFNNTYENLKQFISELDIYINKLSDPNKSKLKVLYNSYEYSDIINFIFGVFYFDLEIKEAILFFRSNTYFWDAIKFKQKRFEYNDVKNLLNVIEYEKALNYDELKLIYNDLKVLYEMKEQFSNYKIDFNFLDKNGYMIVENVLDAKFCDEINSLTLKIADFEKHNNNYYLYGDGKMQRVYSLISKNYLYQQLVVNPVIHYVMNYMFRRDTFHEKYYLTSFHANILSESCENQIWHIDANVPEPIPNWIIRSNSNLITQEYSRLNGATEVLPGSHLWNKKPNNKEARNIPIEFKSQFLEAPKGSIIFWHGNLWHRSGVNSTKERRVALLGGYCASFLREMSMEENIYLNFNQNQISKLSTKLKNILGWNHGLKDYDKY